MGTRNQGVPPSDALGWVELSGFTHNKRLWTVWLKEPISQAGWADIKVVLAGRTKFKANYRVSYSVAEGRFARSSEFVKLLTSGLSEPVLDAIYSCPSLQSHPLPL